MTMITKPGFYDMPEYIYHSDPCFVPSLSSSGAKALVPGFADSPYHYWHKVVHPEAYQPKSKAMNFGTAAHMLLLEPERFDDEIHVLPDGFSPHHHKKWSDDLPDYEAAVDDGKVIIKQQERDALDMMAEALRVHETTLSRFIAAPKEQSAFWHDPKANIICRGRFDFLPKSGNIVADYKTTGTGLTDAAIERSIDNAGWHVQAAHYMDCLVQLGRASDPGFIFIVQETTAPFCVRIVQLDDETLDIGRRKLAKARDVFRTCLMSGDWPQPSSTEVGDDGVERITSLGLPGWARNRFDMMHADNKFIINDNQEGHAA